MVNYSYGPFVWGPEGNMIYPLEPAGYDDIGIPVDSAGKQLLSLDCILHPHHIPTATEYNEYLSIQIPSLKTTKSWFTKNFFDITDDQVKKYIIYWLLKNPNHIIKTYCTRKALECGSIEKFKELIYGT